MTLVRTTKLKRGEKAVAVLAAYPPARPVYVVERIESKKY